MEAGRTDGGGRGGRKRDERAREEKKNEQKTVQKPCHSINQVLGLIRPKE